MRNLPIWRWWLVDSQIRIGCCSGSQPFQAIALGCCHVTSILDPPSCCPVREMHCCLGQLCWDSILAQLVINVWSQNWKYSSFLLPHLFCPCIYHPFCHASGVLLHTATVRSARWQSNAHQHSICKYGLLSLDQLQPLQLVLICWGTGYLCWHMARFVAFFIPFLQRLIKAIDSSSCIAWCTLQPIAQKWFNVVRASSVAKYLSHLYLSIIFTWIRRYKWNSELERTGPKTSRSI